MGYLTITHFIQRLGILSTSMNAKHCRIILRINKGLEKTIMATMQAFLSNERPNILTGDEACSIVIYGSSISNQVNIVYLLLED